MIRTVSLFVEALFVAMSAAFAAERPNIVFVLADDLGWGDTGFAGAEFYETPNLDFERFLAAISVDNWREARAALARAFGNDGEAVGSLEMEQFWRRVGEVGGEKVD